MATTSRQGQHTKKRYGSSDSMSIPIRSDHVHVRSTPRWACGGVAIDIDIPRLRLDDY